MIHNYLMLAYRNLLGKKVFSLINILGLSIGITAVLLIYLFVSNELSYDAFHLRKDRIFRVLYHSLEGGKVKGRDAHVPAILAKTYKDEIPEIEQATRLFALGHISKPVFRYGSKKFNETLVYLADSNVHQVFSMEYVSGNPAAALQKPNSVVLTEETAHKYFGDENPLGKLILIDEEPLEVTGVVKAFPRQSHFHFNMLLSMSSFKGSQNIWWLDNAFMTYVLLKPDAQTTHLQAKIDSVTKKHIGWQYQKVFNKSYERTLAEGNGHRYALFPLMDMHLHTPDIYDFEKHGDILYVYLFSIVGGIILLIACFNYINLATAKSATRAKEVGVRKVLGAAKTQLVGLFLTQSFLVVAIAIGIALTVVQGLLIFDNDFIGEFLPERLFTPGLIIWILVLLLVIGVLSGILPALYLSAYQPVKVLKGELTKAGKGEKVRNALVVVQFCISTGLIVCTLVVKEQIHLLQNKHLGFDKENVLVLDNLNLLGNRQAALKKVLANEASIASVSLLYNRLGNPHNVTSFTAAKATANGENSSVGIPRYITDTGFLDLMKIKVVAGRNFSPNPSNEHPQIMLSQEAIRQGGWGHKSPEELIGQPVSVIGKKYELVAIIEDFHFRSLKHKKDPVALFSEQPGQPYEHLLIRVKPGNFNRTLQIIEQHWQAIAPDVPFVYSFLDENLNKLYQSEKQMAGIFNGFSVLAIFIACLGLFGLAIFTAERRTKEIGVRKVLGASLKDILLLVNKDFIKLILLANLISWPLAYWAASQWLENYAFSIKLTIWLFMVPTLLVLALALIIISIQLWKTANMNPTKALRYE